MVQAPSITYSMTVDVSPKQFKIFFETMKGSIEKAVDQQITIWLNDLRTYALKNKPWRDRTYALRRSHRIGKSREGQFLIVDTRLEGAELNYGYLLENFPHLFSRDYAWIMPALNVMLPQLTGRMKAAVDASIKDVEAGRTIGIVPAKKLTGVAVGKGGGGKESIFILTPVSEKG